MNNHLLLSFAIVLSACGMQHMGRLDGAEADGGSDDHVLVIVDGSQADAQMFNDAGDPDATPDAVETGDPDVVVADSGQDAGTDSGQEAGTDAGTDTAPDVTPTCDFGYEYCNGDCHRASQDPSMCGTSCSTQVCSTGQSCDYNLQNHYLCCAPVLTLTDGSVGHCPAGSCGSGRCFAEVTGFNVVTWFCCPAS